MWPITSTPSPSMSASKAMTPASSPSDCSTFLSSTASSDDGRACDGIMGSHVSLASSETGHSFASSPPMTPDESMLTMLNPMTSAAAAKNAGARLDAAHLAGLADFSIDGARRASDTTDDPALFVLAPEEAVFSSSDGPSEADALIDIDTIGLGLTSPQADAFDGSRRRRIIGSATSESSFISGPFAHHRSPSWVVQAHVEAAHTTIKAPALDPLSETPSSAPTLTLSQTSDCLPTAEKHRPRKRLPPLPVKAKNRTSSLAYQSMWSRPGSLDSDESSSDSTSKKSDKEFSIVPKARTSSRNSVNSTLSSPLQANLSHADVGSSDTAFALHSASIAVPSSSMTPPLSSMCRFPSSESHPAQGHFAMSSAAAYGMDFVEGAQHNDEPLLEKNFASRFQIGRRRRANSRGSFLSSRASSSAPSDSMETQRAQRHSSSLFRSSRPSTADDAQGAAAEPSNALESIFNASTKTILGLDDVFWNGGDFALGIDERIAESESTGLAVSFAEDGRDVRVEANGRSMKDIEMSITAHSTHIVLSGCNEPGMFEFLERILPLVSRSLLVLDLSHTGLHELPNSLRRCVRLEELNLSHNPALQSSTANFDVLSELGHTLRLLIIDQCELTMLPGSLVYLRQLRMLSACGNHLTHLPAWLHRLKHLERLLLSNNSFQGTWQSICQAFVAEDASQAQDASRGTGKNSYAASSVSSNDLRSEPSTTACRLSGFWSSSQEYEVVEELSEAPMEKQLVEDADSPAVEEPTIVPSAQSKGRSLRPFVRRMLSAGDLKAEQEAAQKNAVAEAESKWGAIKRKMIRKASHSDGKMMDPSSTVNSGPTLTVVTALASQTSLHSALADSLNTEKSASISSLPSAAVTLNSAKGPQEDTSKQPTSAAAIVKQTREARKRTRRMSFLPFGISPAETSPKSDDESAEAVELLDIDVATEEEEHARNRRNVRLLMQYLEDLSDLNPVQRHMQLYTSALPSRPTTSDSSMSRSSVRRRTRKRNGTRSSRSSRSSTNLDQVGQSKVAKSRGEVESKQPLEFGQMHANGTGSASGALAAMTIKDDACRRMHIIHEIIATEKSYIKMLRELIDIYVIPSGQRDSVSQLPALPAMERRQVFGNVEGILHFHSEAFLPALQSAAMCATDVSRGESGAEDAAYAEATLLASERIARTFEHHAAFFRMYTSYVNNVDAAQQRIAVWQTWQATSAPYSRNGGSTLTLRRESHAVAMSASTLEHGGMSSSSGSSEATNAPMSAKERKRLRTFMQKARSDPRHSQISLEAYIHLPVQRIPRYRLLLEDLVRVCPPARLSEPELIFSALQSVASIATMINESKRQSEMDRKLLQWQERIRGTFPSPLVQPHRKLIHDGSLTLRRIVSRVPSFTVNRSAVLGEGVVASDPYEEHVMLRVADASRYIEMDDPPMMRGEDEQGDRRESQEAGVLQIHHLERQNVHRHVQVILCNDITVIVEDARESGQVDLFAVLRSTGPARVVNERTLRIADPKHILYLDAATKYEAEAWREALSMAYQSSPSAQLL